MAHNKFRWGLSVLAGLSATLHIATPAQAETSTTRINIQGVVPTICRVEFSQPLGTVHGEAVNFGQMTQLCNNAEGYRVVMQHPAGLTGAFLIDGVATPLSSGTETVLVDSNNPTYRMAGASIQLAAGSSQFASVSFRIEPKGMTY